MTTTILAAPVSAVGSLRPRRKQLGMIEMKRLTLELDPLYRLDKEGVRLSRHAWLGYLYELFNFSNGQRTLGEIARALSHEIGPIDVNVLARMSRDLERMGFFDVQGE
jgi:hypothetical protein